MLLYTSFHLNLMYSSIEVEQRPIVIDRCYRPLLNLAKNFNIPIGIEASGLTLEIIEQLDPKWIELLQSLIQEKKCEFIASGYSQSIGPLMPAGVNIANLNLGNRCYHRILNAVPRLVLVNEQAFSSSMISHYLDAGFDAIIMEWNNPAFAHTSWRPEWRYLPQYACDQHGRKIPLVWNNSIYFQKFQHYVHGEKNLESYLQFLTSHVSDTPRAFSLYGNDAEIFNFRPGRFHTEASIGNECEWLRIESLFKKLQTEENFEIVFPSKVLEFMQFPGAGNELSLESPVIPIPVKKQEKYNITRWAVTGRDDLGVNTACQRIYRAMTEGAIEDPSSWQELCYLWSSDFRTHITQNRWEAYLERLASAQRRFNVIAPVPVVSTRNAASACTFPSDVAVVRSGHILSIESDVVKVELNIRRGLAVDGICFKTITKEKLFGTLPHGFYDNITLGADFYSGHLVFETLGKPKLTDLEVVEPDVSWNPADHSVAVSCSLKSALGEIRKSVLVQAELGEIEILYEIDWNCLPVGSLRFGMITLFPESFSRETLFFRTHSGGTEMEIFHPKESSINHGESASFLVSAKHALGLTEGILELGDANKFLRISVDTSMSAVIGLMTFTPLTDTYFFRCALSAREMDETSRASEDPVSLFFKIKISASFS